MFQSSAASKHTTLVKVYVPSKQKKINKPTTTLCASKRIEANKQQTVYNSVISPAQFYVCSFSFSSLPPLKSLLWGEDKGTGCLTRNYGLSMRPVYSTNRSSLLTVRTDNATSDKDMISAKKNLI